MTTVRNTVRLNAAASTPIDGTLAAAPRPASVLGVVDHAVYLELAAGEVVAVLTSDAIRLPCALVLPVSSRERPLTRLGPRAGESAMIGHGCVQWSSRAGLVAIHVVRHWAPPVVVPLGPGWADGLGALEQAIAGPNRVDIGIEAELLGSDAIAGIAAGVAGLVLALLGRGPGLTPSGDDVLAGLLLGARAFGLAAGGLARMSAAIDALAPARTTSLSARLLRHAGAGECVPELAALLAALPDARRRAPAIGALLRLGHTSGAAVACGIVKAAELALTPAG